MRAGEDREASCDIKRAIMMGMRPSELEKHLILTWDRFETYPKAEAAIREHAEQMCHN